MDLLDRLLGHDLWTSRALLKQLGVHDLPEGDVLSWEQQLRGGGAVSGVQV
jgi:hypothetical protein